LVAIAIASVALLAFGSLVANARRAAANSMVASDGSRALDLAAALLVEEVRMAGSLPWPRPALVEGTEDPEAFLANALWLYAGDSGGDSGGASDGAVQGAGGASLRVRYVDDRLAGTPVARDVTFEVGVDGRGVTQLYRRPAGATRQPLVEGVDSLRLVGVVEDGILIAPPVAGAYRPSAVVLEVTVQVEGADGPRRATRQVVVPIPNAPAATVSIP